jgi:hypothetical protein
LTTTMSPRETNFFIPPKSSVTLRVMPAGVPSVTTAKSGKLSSGGNGPKTSPQVRLGKPKRRAVPTEPLMNSLRVIFCFIGTAYEVEGRNTPRAEPRCTASVASPVISKHLFASPVSLNLSGAGRWCQPYTGYQLKPREKVAG